MKDEALAFDKCNGVWYKREPAMLPHPSFIISKKTKTCWNGSDQRYGAWITRLEGGTLFEIVDTYIEDYGDLSCSPAYI